MGNSKIFQTYKNKNIDLLILTTLLLIILTLFLIKLSNIDVFIQNYFFDFTDKEWLIDKSEPFKKNIFHKLPKIIFGLLILLTIFFAFKYRTNNYFRYQQALLIVIGLTVNPIISANIKKFTNIYCPAQLKIYSGNHDYHKIFYINQPDELKNKKGQCFPAGHAVAGFSLFILFFVFQTRFLQISSLIMAILAGWIIGSYQIIKGDHFFGDTLISMLLCFVLSAIIARIFFTIKKINKFN